MSSRVQQTSILSRQFATQPDTGTIDVKSNGKQQDRSPLCDKIGFIGAGKIAQVPAFSNPLLSDYQ